MKRTYLIAHSNPDGTGIAQVRIVEKGWNLALSTFREMYPKRTLVTSGVLGIG